MEKMFCLGLVFGALGGALLVANSYKMRSLVKKSQAEFVDKVNDLVDERLNESKTPEDQTEKKERRK